MRRRVLTLAGLCALGLVVLAGRSQRLAPPPFDSHDDCGAEALSARATPTGHAASWRLPVRPARACDVVLELHAPADVGPAVLVDARGQSHHVAATRDGDRVRFHLSRALLDAAEFPAVLDPWVGPAVSAPVVRDVAAGFTVALATNGSEWLALGTSASIGSLLTQVDPTGAVGPQANLRGSAWAAQLFGYTDRYVTISPSGVHRGRTWAELADSGLEPTPPGYDISSRWLAASDAGIMYTRATTLVDGGPAFELHRLLPDLSGDGPGLLIVEGYPQGPGVLEGDTFYFVSTSSFARVLVTRLDLQSLRAVPLPDGGDAPSGLMASTGAVSLLMWVDVDPLGYSLFGLRVQQGNPIGPVQLLAQWPTPMQLASVGWDARAFHVALTRPDDQLIDVVLQHDGGVLGPVVLAPTRYGRGSVRLSGTPNGALLVHASGWGDDPAARASRLPLTPPVALDAGTLLFHATSVGGLPSLSWRGSELLAGWNDNRLGADVNELWGRRFDAALQPLDPDSFCLSFVDRTTPHYDFNTSWRTFGPQFLAATPTGWIAVRTDSFNVAVHRLDATGRPTGGELAVSTMFGLNLSPLVVANDTAAFIAWFHVGTGFVGTVLAPDDSFTAETPLGPNVLATVATRTMFVAVLPHELLSVPSSGTGLATLASFPATQLLTAASNSESLLVLDVVGTGTVTAHVVELDGGVGAAEPVATLPSPVTEARFAWDGRRYVGVLVLDEADAGVFAYATMRRAGDAGWVTPARIAPLDVSPAIAAVPDAGLVLALGQRDVVLRRIDWFANGTPCGANTECESELCVDGVCCNAACGGGAVDCIACSKAAGAPVDGVCTALQANQVCRPAATVCDVPEVCDGVALACPADGVVDAGVMCRAAASVCDVADRCDGVSVTCPADAVADAGRSCRAAAGPCDVEDVCDGVRGACPDVLAAVGVGCAAPSPCDAGSQCDGTNVVCPAPVCQATEPPRAYPVGCGCRAGPLPLVLLAALALRRRRP